MCVWEKAHVQHLRKLLLANGAALGSRVDAATTHIMVGDHQMTQRRAEQRLEQELQAASCVTPQPVVDLQVRRYGLGGWLGGRCRP